MGKSGLLAGWNFKCLPIYDIKVCLFIPWLLDNLTRWTKKYRPFKLFYSITVFTIPTWHYRTITSWQKSCWIKSVSSAQIVYTCTVIWSTHKRFCRYHYQATTRVPVFRTSPCKYSCYPQHLATNVSSVDEFNWLLSPVIGFLRSSDYAWFFGNNRRSRVRSGFDVHRSQEMASA